MTISHCQYTIITAIVNRFWTGDGGNARRRGPTAIGCVRAAGHPP
jgi:hypothetical protein